jgi:succinoglycan biosynthesis protein ExoL
MRLVYFVHDLNDPGVARRVAMLRAGGIDLMLAGFWRRDATQTFADCKVIPLSQTFDSRLVHRAGATLWHSAAAKKIARELDGVQMFLARNLEMLAIAVATSRHMRGTPAIAYEMIDVHRSLLSESLRGRALRCIERALMKRVALLITSSPAFLREYFGRRQFLDRATPALIVENKLFTSQPQCVPSKPIRPGPPWRIGWFGVIRCRRSMEILGALARRRPDLVEIAIRGRVAQPARKSLAGALRCTPAVNFGGAYTTDELQKHYDAVHFNWTIDYFEDGGNSEWLLPNRIYEGGSFDVVPIALKRNETGRWLADKHLGVLLDDPMSELEGFLETLDVEGYSALKQASARASRSLFIADEHDCERLAAALRAAAACRATARADAYRAAA